MHRREIRFGSRLSCTRGKASGGGCELSLPRLAKYLNSESGFEQNLNRAFKEVFMFSEKWPFLAYISKKSCLKNRVKQFRLSLLTHIPR